MEERLKEMLQSGRKLTRNMNHHQKKRSATALFVSQHIQKADQEKNGFNAQNVKCGRMKSAQKVVLFMFATIANPNDLVTT